MSEKDSIGKKRKTSASSGKKGNSVKKVIEKKRKKYSYGDPENGVKVVKKPLKTFVNLSGFNLSKRAIDKIDFYVSLLQKEPNYLSNFNSKGNVSVHPKTIEGSVAEQKMIAPRINCYSDSLVRIAIYAALVSNCKSINDKHVTISAGAIETLFPSGKIDTIPGAFKRNKTMEGVEGKENPTEEECWEMVK